MSDIVEADIKIEDMEDETIPYKYFITGYGADYLVDGLVKRVKNGDIYIPSFQRSYVWNIKQASLFIESLLLGLPVPGIFLAVEEETEKKLVIDGQQRLLTLQYFYDGKFVDNRKFTLQGIVSEFEGATYESLFAGDRRRLDDTILHATVVKQDKPTDDNSSIYHIFHRLNTGGTQLRPQEIRACIYHGEFNELLTKLNENRLWRSLYGKPNSDKYMKDVELILRFFALYFNGNNYSSPMKRFLNEYMGGNSKKKLTPQRYVKLTEIFDNTIEIIHKHLGDKPFAPIKNFNAASFDAVMVGIARRLEQGDIDDFEGLNEQHKQLLANKDFLSAIGAGTASVDNVKRRIMLATDAFIDVK